jgi:hypothetical protein
MWVEKPINCPLPFWFNFESNHLVLFHVTVKIKRKKSRNPKLECTKTKLTKKQNKLYEAQQDKYTRCK